jgi:hypothetical protein
LEVLYYLIIRPLLDTDDEEERREKSMEVQDQAAAYVDAFAAAVGREFCTLYMHHMLVHIPRQVEDLELDITVVSQQGFKNLLKQGKTDMKLFTNKQLKNERQQYGRNYQVIGKERERVFLKRMLPVPQTRNKKRCLAGEKSLQAHARATVERAVRRGQLGPGSGPANVESSKGKKTLEKRIGKVALKLQAIVERIQRVRNDTGAMESEEESDEDDPLTSEFRPQPPPPEPNRSSSILVTAASESGALLAGALVDSSAEAEAGTADRVHVAPAAELSLAGARTSASAALAGRGSASARGRPAGGRMARGGRGGGRTALGRRIHASARMQR